MNPIRFLRKIRYALRCLRTDIRVFKDGDKWCALRGENLQSGDAAFGENPHQALSRFLKSYGEG